jgi:hypothetical protein
MTETNSRCISSKRAASGADPGISWSISLNDS